MQVTNIDILDAMLARCGQVPPYLASMTSGIGLRALTWVYHEMLMIYSPYSYDMSGVMLQSGFDEPVLHVTDAEVASGIHTTRYWAWKGLRQAEEAGLIEIEYEEEQANIYLSDRAYSSLSVRGGYGSDTRMQDLVSVLYSVGTGQPTLETSTVSELPSLYMTSSDEDMDIVREPIIMREPIILVPDDTDYELSDADTDRMNIQCTRYYVSDEYENLDDTGQLPIQVGATLKAGRYEEIPDPCWFDQLETWQMRLELVRLGEHPNRYDSRTDLAEELYYTVQHSDDEYMRSHPEYDGPRYAGIYNLRVLPDGRLDLKTRVVDALAGKCDIYGNYYDEWHPRPEDTVEIRTPDEIVDQVSGPDLARQHHDVSVRESMMQNADSVRDAIARWRSENNVPEPEEDDEPDNGRTDRVLRSSNEALSAAVTGNRSEKLDMHDRAVFEVIHYYEFLAAKELGTASFKAVSRDFRSHRDWPHFNRITDLIMENHWDFMAYVRSQFDRVAHFDHKQVYPYPNQMYSDVAQHWFLKWESDEKKRLSVEGTIAIKQPKPESLYQRIAKDVRKTFDGIRYFLSVTRPNAPALRRMNDNDAMIWYLDDNWFFMSPYYLATFPWMRAYIDDRLKWQGDGDYWNRHTSSAVHKICASRSLMRTCREVVSDLRPEFGIPNMVLPESRSELIGALY